MPMKPKPIKHRQEKIKIPHVKIDPIVVDIPEMVGEFVRFETRKKGDTLFVVYKIVPKENSENIKTNSQ